MYAILDQCCDMGPVVCACAAIRRQYSVSYKLNKAPLPRYIKYISKFFEIDCNFLLLGFLAAGFVDSMLVNK